MNHREEERVKHLIVALLATLCFYRRQHVPQHTFSPGVYCSFVLTCNGFTICIEAAKPFVVKYKEALTVRQVNTLSGLDTGKLQLHVLQSLYSRLASCMHRQSTARQGFNTSLTVTGVLPSAAVVFTCLDLNISHPPSIAADIH